MTCGIYKLTFDGLEDFPYIGKSINIERRYREHCSRLAKGTDENKKLHDAYVIAGLPKVSILLECTPEESDAAELDLINQYNSIKQGLNMSISGFISKAGTEHNRSKYSKDQILKALVLCANPLNKYSYISRESGVSQRVVVSIIYEQRHAWVKLEQPEILKEAQLGRKASGPLAISNSYTGLIEFNT